MEVVKLKLNKLILIIYNMGNHMFNILTIKYYVIRVKLNTTI